MSAADDFLNRPRALRMVVSLVQHGSMSAGEFGEEAEYVPEAAKKLRDELEAWGLVHVEEVMRNNAPSLRVTPTTAARRVADLARDLKDVMDRDRAIKALVAIDAIGPLTSRQLAAVTGYVPDRAKRLREDLERLGFVSVEAAAVNAALGHRIALTLKGRRAVEAAQEVGRVVERAATKAGA
jgi:DNA-binding MarR family transcriptional regulator